MRDLDILESWKEIADCLKKSERTCRRWEQEFNLPIHRMDGSPKARVFAYKHELDKWVQEMLKEADDSEKRRISFRSQPITKKASFLIIGAIILVIASLLIWHPWSREKSELIPSEKPSLAIMYFKNNTGDENLDHWRTMITDLFIADLTQSKYLNVLSGERLFQVLSDLNQLEADSYSSGVLKQIAELSGVSHLMLGNYAKAGETIRINVVLQEVGTEKILVSEGVEGKGEQSIFTLVDELTRRIKSNFNLTHEQIISDIDREVGKITTSSPEAFIAYIEGRKANHMGNFWEGIKFLEKAVSIDSDFAMAYRRLGSAYAYVGNYAKRTEFYKKAFELADRISDRERYQIQGDYYRIDWRTHKQAVEAFTKLLELYPDDPTCNQNFGSLYRLNDEWDRAIERYEANINNKEYSGYMSRFQIAETYGHKGMYDKAKEILELYLIENPDHQRIRYKLADTYLDQGMYELAHSEVDKALLIAPSFFTNINLKGKIYLCQGDLSRAEEQFIRIIKLDQKASHLPGLESLVHLNLAKGTFAEAEKQARIGIELAEELADKGYQYVFYRRIAHIHQLLNQTNKALEESEKALQCAEESGSFDRLRRAYQLKGLSLIEMGLLDEAETVAEELKGLIEEGINRKAVRDYYYLIGQIEMEKKQFLEAIEHFEQTISLSQKNGYYLSFYYEPLALAYFKSGDMKSAEEQYKKIISLPTVMIEYGDVCVKSFYMLGKIYEQQGDTAKAIDYYEKFLDLWKDADPGMAEVEDARERLAKLKYS